jgi:acyl dehydratase
MAVDRFPIEAGHVLCFARAIGDDNPIYHDESYAAGTECQKVIAPPTFVAADVQFDPDWHQRPRIGEPWYGSGATPSGAPSPTWNRGNRLHAEEHFEYHAPIHPGDVLTVEVEDGATWEKHSERAGRLQFSEQVKRYYNQESILVVSVWRVRVLTERPAGSSR